MRVPELLGHSASQKFNGSFIFFDNLSAEKSNRKYYCHISTNLSKHIHITLVFCQTQTPFEFLAYYTSVSKVNCTKSNKSCYQLERDLGRQNKFSATAFFYFAKTLSFYCGPPQLAGKHLTSCCCFASPTINCCQQ